MTFYVRTDERPTFLRAIVGVERKVRQTFTMHYDVLLDGTDSGFERRVPTKTYRAELVSLVDVDNPPGVYFLHSLIYGDPEVGSIAYETNFGEEAPEFYIYKGRHPQRERVVKTWLMDPPDEDG